MMARLRRPTTFDGPSTPHSYTSELVNAGTLVEVVSTTTASHHNQPITSCRLLGMPEWFAAIPLSELEMVSPLELLAECAP